MRGPGNREGPSREVAASFHPSGARREGYAPASWVPVGDEAAPREPWPKGSCCPRQQGASDPKGRPWGLEWDPSFCGIAKAFDNYVAVSSGGYSHGTPGMPTSGIHTPMGLGTERF